MFFIDPEKLSEVARRRRDDYREAAPFPHAVMDDLFPEDVLRSLVAEFPRPGDIDWVRFRNREEKKLATKDESQMGEATRMALYQLNSSAFVSFLEALTGIDGLIPDPHFWGGGLHQIERGGYLKVHADFNRHERLRLDRRLNLLLYLNEGWKEEYGGHLELWDREMKRCERRVLPVFNRCVVFSTTDYSFHGHPDPVTCPEGWTRKSLALYYYSNGRPSEELSGDHGTLFKQRPDERRASKIMAALKKLAPGKAAPGDRG
ncbi:MAG TPA: 2OG-Fe(II) oxygenase [Blastocatellia bacterium]|nr:2OG-Fe(II) oxygenase [Blastocatellia bacterium]